MRSMLRGGLLGLLFMTATACGTTAPRVAEATIHAALVPALASAAEAPPHDASPTPVPPEVVRVESRRGDMSGTCLGVLVHARLALTASHCAVDWKTITVRAPRGVGSARVSDVLYDARYEADHDGRVDLGSADIALLVLAKPIELETYPSILLDPLRRPTVATAIRRGPSGLAAAPITIRLAPGTSYYVSEPFARVGDSGGPVFVEHDGRRILAGVLAGGSSERELLARVDVFSEVVEHAARAVD